MLLKEMVQIDQLTLSQFPTGSGYEVHDQADQAEDGDDPEDHGR